MAEQHWRASDRGKMAEALEQWPNLYWLPLPEIDGHAQGGWFCYRHVRMTQAKPTHYKQTHPPTPVSFSTYAFILKQKRTTLHPKRRNRAFCLPSSP